MNAVSALILGAVKMNAVLIAVDLRKRMIPPLPEQAIGNICQPTMTNWGTKVVEYKGLAEKNSRGN